LKGEGSPWTNCSFAALALGLLAGLRAHLAVLLNGRIVNLLVKHVDLVNDTTLVEVRYVAAAVAPRPLAERIPA
jgi:hypothetical protein